MVNEYYLKRFQKEKIKFYGLSNFAKARPNIEKLEAELQCSAGQMILRIGHYSQVEFVTVQDNNFTKKDKQKAPTIRYYSHSGERISLSGGFALYAMH